MEIPTNEEIIMQDIEELPRCPRKLSCHDYEKVAQIENYGFKSK